VRWGWPWLTEGPTLPTGLETCYGAKAVTLWTVLPPVSLCRAQWFSPLQKHLASKRFAADATVKQAVTSWPQTPDTDFFYTGIQGMVPRWHRSLSVSRDTGGSGVYRLMLRSARHLIFRNFFVNSVVLVCGDFLLLKSYASNSDFPKIPRLHAVVPPLISTALTWSSSAAVSNSSLQSSVRVVLLIVPGSTLPCAQKLYPEPVESTPQQNTALL
jgi:hypothetical protein